VNISECFEKRLLRRISPDINKAKRSLEIADNKLKTAKESLNKMLYGPTIIYGYTSMFHSSRALLYKDGISAKSHYCLVLYIRENYSNEIAPYLINSLDSYRKERHETLYGLEFVVTKKDASLIIKDAEQLFSKISEILENSNKF